MIRLNQPSRKVKRPSLEERKRQNQQQAQFKDLLPGLKPDTKEEEKAANQAADTKFKRQLANRMRPVIEKVTRKLTPDEIRELQKNTHFYNPDVDRSEAIRNKSIGEKAGYLFEKHALGEQDVSSTVGTYYPDGRIRVGTGFRPNFMVKKTYLHEEIHRLKENDEKKQPPKPPSPGVLAGMRRFFYRNIIGMESEPKSLIQSAADEFYAQGPATFVNFRDSPRPSDLKKSANRFSPQNIENHRQADREDPLGLFKGKDLIISNLITPSPHSLGRAYLLKLIGEGKIRKPAEVYKMPQKEVEAGLAQMQRQAKWIYAARLGKFFYGLPANTLENLKRHLSKPTKQVK